MRTKKINKPNIIKKGVELLFARFAGRAKKSIRNIVVAISSTALIILLVLLFGFQNHIDFASADYLPGWGVLAFNLNKSDYAPDEDVHVSIAVLDDLGATVCDAAINVGIFKDSSPKPILTLSTEYQPDWSLEKNVIENIFPFFGINKDSGTIVQSPDCEKAETTNHDYHSQFSLHEPGEYEIIVVAKNGNGVYSSKEHFIVRQPNTKPDFVVERVSLTRIYPPATYTMSLRITPKEDYVGTVKETVPSLFDVVPEKQAVISKEGEKKLITWQVDWQAGQTYVMNYQFQGPPKSPDFYLMGPLEIGEFTEGRSWQIASDIISVAAVDATASAQSENVDGDGRKLVWTNDTTGYLFYTDGSTFVSYSKTTNAGMNWGAAVTLTARASENFSIWYDQWTPGNTGGLIHIAFLENAGDDIYYEYVDTASADAQKGEVAVVSRATAHTALTDSISITRATDGDLYIAYSSSTAATTSGVRYSTDVGTNWNDTAAEGLDDTSGDAVMLLPQPAGDILMLRWDISADDIQSKEYEDGANAWDGAWTDIDTNAVDSTTLTETWAATLKPSTWEVFLAYVDNAGTTGSSVTDVRTATYSGSAWAAKTNVYTDYDTISGVTIGLDTLTNDVFVAYLRGLAAGPTVVQAYYKISRDNMSTWELERGNVVNFSGAFRGIMGNFASPYRISVWAFDDTGADIWFGDLQDIGSHANALQVTNMEGFETQSSLTAAVAVTGTPTYSTSVYRSGAASLRTDPSSSTEFVTHTFSYGTNGKDALTNYDNFNSVFALRVASGTTINQQSIIYSATDGTTVVAELSINADQTLSLTTGTDVNGSFALVDDTWYIIAFAYGIDSDVLRVGIYSSDMNTFHESFEQSVVSATTMDRVRIGPQTASTTADLYFDDFMVYANNITRNFPLLRADYRIEPMVLDSTGTDTAWTNTYTNLTELPTVVSDASYIESQAATAAETSGLESASSAGISGNVLALRVTNMIWESSAATTSIQGIRVREGASIENTTAVDAGGTAAAPINYSRILTDEVGTTSLWDTTSLDALEVGVLTATAETVFYRNGSTVVQVAFVPASTITISGTCQAFDQSTNCGDTGTVKVAINGVLQAQEQATVAGTWSITGVPKPPRESTVTVFIDAAADADEAVAVTRYDGAGDITDVTLYKEHVTFGSVDNQTVRNYHLGQYDYTNDEDIFADVDINAGNTLNADAASQSSQEELYVSTGDTYEPYGTTTTVAVELVGTLTLDTQTMNVAGTWTNGGTFNEGTSTVVLNGATSVNFNSSCSNTDTCTNENFYNLTINKTDASDANDNVTLTTNGLRITNTLTITDGELVQGALNVRVEGATAVSIASGGKWNNISTGDVKLGGTFTSAGTAIFNSNGGSQCTDAANDIVITSTVADTTRLWTNTGTLNLYNVEADDMTDSAITAYTSDLTDAQTTWTAGNCGITVSGTAYTDHTEGSTLNSSGGSIKLVNAATGDSFTDSDGTDGTGLWSISNVTTPSNGNDLIIYINDTTADGTLVLQYGASCTGTPNCTGLKLYQNAVIIRNEHTGSVTNQDLSGCDNDSGTNCADTEIGYTSNLTGTYNLSVSSGRELHIWTGDTFDPDGDVDTNATGGDFHIDDNATASLDTATSTIGQTIDIDAGATLTISATTVVSGGGEAIFMSGSGATLNVQASTTVTGGLEMDNGATTISSTFDVTGDLDVNTGTLDIDASANVDFDGVFCSQVGATINLDGGTTDGTGNDASHFRFNGGTINLNGGTHKPGPNSIVEWARSTTADCLSDGSTGNTTFNMTGGDLWGRGFAVYGSYTFTTTTTSGGTLHLGLAGIDQAATNFYDANTNAHNFFNLVIEESASIHASTSQTIKFVGSVTINSPRDLDLNGKTIQVDGGWVDNGSLTADSGTVILRNGNVSGSADTTFYNLTIGDSTTSNTVTLTGTDDPIVTNTMTVDTTDNYSIGASRTTTINTTASLTLSGTISGAGRLIYKPAAAFPTGGTISSILRFDSTSNDQIMSARTYGGTVESRSENLATYRTLTMGTAGGQTINITGSLLVHDDANGMSVDATTYDPDVNITGDLGPCTMFDGAPGFAANAGTWTVTGNVNMTLCWGSSFSAPHTLVMDGTSKTLTTSLGSWGNVTITGSITLASSNHTIGGNVVLTGSTITPGSSTMNMIGAGTSLTGAGQTLYNLTINPSVVGTITAQTSDVTVSNTLNVAASDQFTINSGITVTHTGATLTLSGTINGPGRYTYRSSTTFPTGGALGSTLILRFDATNNNQTMSQRSDYPNVEIYSSSGLFRTVTMGTAASQTITIVGNLKVIGDGLSTILSSSTNDPTVNITGNIEACSAVNDATLVADAGTWTVSGNVDFTTCIVTFSGTHTLAMNGASKTITTAANTMENFSVTGGSVSTVDAFAADDTFTIGASATLTQGANVNITLTGDTVLIADTGDFVKASGSGKFIMDGVSDNQTFEDANTDSKEDMGAVQIGMSPGTTKLKSDFSASSLTILTGDTFETHGWEVDISGSIDCQGTCTFNLTDNAPSNEGNGTIVTFGGNWTMSGTGTFTPSTDSRVEPDGTADQTVTTGGKAFWNFYVNNAGATDAVDDVIISGALDVNGSLTINDGELDLSTNNPAVTIADDMIINSGGDLLKGTGGVTFDGASTAGTYTDSSSGGPLNIGVVSVNKTAGVPATDTVTLATSMKTDTVTVNSGDTLDLADSGYTLEIANAGSTATVLTITGTLDTGTNSLVKFSATNSGGVITVPVNPYHDIQFSGSETYELGGNLTGSNDIDGNVTIDASATLDAKSGSDYDIDVAENWTKTGGFTARNGGVNFDGADGATQVLSGSTSFYDFTASTSGNAAGRTLRFTASTTQTVTGTWTITGFSGKKITLESSSSPTQWTINPTAASVTYVQVSDSNNTGVAFCASFSTDTGNNNTNWSISATATCGIDVAGTSNSSGGTVRVAVNTSLQAQTTTLAATWTITGVTVNSGDIVTVFVEGADSAETTGVAQYDGTGNIGGMVLNTNVLGIGSDDNQTIDLTDLDQYSCADNENVMHSVASGVLDVEGTDSGCGANPANSYTDETVKATASDPLSIGNSQTMNAHNVTIDASGSITSGTSGVFDVSGTWDNNGTFTASTSTVTFSSGSTETVEAGSSSFNNVVFANAAGNWTVQTDNMTTNDLTLTSGTFTLQSGRTLTVGGNFTLTTAGANTTWTGSTLYLNGSGGMYDINTKTHGGDTFATLRIGASEDIASWDSSASSYTIDSGACLFSEDHAGTAGRMNIYGTCNSRTNEYWSYATDFDGAAVTRQADIRFDSGATLTVDNGDTLAILGQNAGANRSLVTRQSSGNYGLTISGTINAQYYDFDYTNDTGLNITSTATVTELSDGTFDNIPAGATSSYITVAGITSTKNFFNNVFDDNGDGANTDADSNINADGSGINWTFFDWSGNKGGESFDNEVNSAFVGWQSNLSLSVSSVLVNLGIINTLIVGSGNHTLSVTTNATNGYTCKAVEDGEIRNGGSTISDVLDGVVSAGSEEYGVSCSGADCDLAGDNALSGTPLTVASNTGPVTGSSTTMTYKAAASSATAGTSYSHIVTYTCSGDF